MVREGVVLLGVEHLEQRGARIAAEVVTDLVDLVHHEDGVDGPGLLHSPDDAAGEGSDVRAPVPPDGGLVVDAAERDADELAAQRAGDAPPERRLSDARRTDEAQDRPLLVLLQLADREVLEDALLDLLEAVVVLVEHPAHRPDVHVVGRLVVPRQVEDPVEVSAHHRVLGAANLHVAKALQLLLRDLLRFRGQVRLGDSLLEAVEIALISVVFSELFLDGLELLAKDVLALVFAHLLLDLGVDALAHLEDLELPGEQLEHLADAILHVERLEEAGLLVDGGVEVRRHEIGERARRLDGIDERARLARELGHELDHLLRDVAQAHAQGLGLVIARVRLVETGDLRLEVGARLGDLVEPDPLEPLQDQRIVSRAVLQSLEHAGRTPDLVKVFAAGIVGRRIALREDRDDRRRQVVDVFDQRDRLLPTDVEWRDSAGKEDGVADGKNRQLVSELNGLVFLPRSLRRRLLLFRHDLGYLSREEPRPAARHVGSLENE